MQAESKARFCVLMVYAQEDLDDFAAVVKPQRGAEIFRIQSHVIAGIRTEKRIRRRRIAAIQILCTVVVLRQRQNLHLRVDRDGIQNALQTAVLVSLLMDSPLPPLDSTSRKIG